MKLALTVVAPGVVLAYLLGVALPGTAGFVLVLAVAAATAAVARAVHFHRVALVTETLANRDGRTVLSFAAMGLPGTWGPLHAVLDERAQEVARAQADAIDRSAWLQGLVANLAQPTLVLGVSDLRVAQINAAAMDLLGHPERDDASAIAAVGSALVVDACREVAWSGERTIVEATVRGRDVRAMVARVDDGILLVLDDLTEVVRAGRLRRDFVVSASHELKTPVAGIEALTSALAVLDGSDEVTRQRVLARLHDEARRLGSLVNDLLDLRQLEDEVTGDRNVVDLVDLVRRVAADLADLAAERDVRVVLEASAGSAAVLGGTSDLELIVRNLLRNALQYTDAGGTVTVRTRAGASGPELEVQDTGIGIPHGQTARIFERFYRVDEARSRATGGTGLGLSIVRNAVERNGGTVSVESLLGHGTTFRVQFEAPADAPDLRPAVSRNGAGP